MNARSGKIRRPAVSGPLAEPGHSGPARIPDDSLALTYGEMNAALAGGNAVPLSRRLDWLVRYQDAWWVIGTDGWFRVTDDLLAGDVERLSAKLRAADDAARSAGGEES